MRQKKHNQNNYANKKTRKNYNDNFGQNVKLNCIDSLRPVNIIKDNTQTFVMLSITRCLTNFKQI